jgi:hypothetical protein
LALALRAASGVRARSCVRSAGAKKSGKKKAPSPTHRSYSGIATGIFRFAVHGESKNGGHPARRPMGLDRARSVTVMKGQKLSILKPKML